MYVIASESSREYISLAGINSFIRASKTIGFYSLSFVMSSNVPREKQKTKTKNPTKTKKKNKKKTKKK